jgi:hypothetical protein
MLGPVDMEVVMNSSLAAADAATHVKIVVVALLLGIVVVWIGLSARVGGAFEGPRLQAPVGHSGVPQASPSGSAKAVV